MSKRIDIKTRKHESWRIFDQIAPTYDRINRVISFGTDKLWRRNFRKYLPQRNGLVCLDLATGTGDVAIELAKDERVSKVVGTDLSEKMIEFGKEKIRRITNSKKITLAIGDGVKIPGKSSMFDVVTVAFGIRNFKDHQESFKNMVRVLKKDGQAMILEFSLPRNRIFRSLYLFYFRNVLPVIGNKLSGHSDAYSYLNQTVEDFPYGEALVKQLLNAGFRQVETKTLSFGIAMLYIGYK